MPLFRSLKSFLRVKDLKVPFTDFLFYFAFGRDQELVERKKKGRHFKVFCFLPYNKYLFFNKGSSYFFLQLAGKHVVENHYRLLREVRELAESKKTNKTV